MSSPERDGEEAPAEHTDGSDQPGGLKILASRRMPNWLAAQDISLVFSTYQANRLFFVGRGAGGRLSVFERYFPRCMGISAGSDTIYVATSYQLFKLVNILDEGAQKDGYDRVFLPRVAYTTGDLDIHDVALDRDGSLVFANTLFSCLATLDPVHSFKPVWRPDFVTRLAPEDRCHLNGVAMRNGRPRFVTVVGRSDVADGWREHRDAGGCVIDVESGSIALGGLSIPHSPRMYRDRLWLLNSGTGEFGYLDNENSAFRAITFCPGFARGLWFSGDYAIIGLSKPRDGSFAGLELQRALSRANASARCGLLVVDIRSGNIENWLRLDGVVEEIYDVATIPNSSRPKAIGILNTEIQEIISAPP